jgi:endonuclease I
MNRNNLIDQKYQHNRNPYIDHPEFLEMIYSKDYTGPGALM